MQAGFERAWWAGGGASDESKVVRVLLLLLLPAYCYGRAGCAILEWTDLLCAHAT